VAGLAVGEVWEWADGLEGVGICGSGHGWSLVVEGGIDGRKEGWMDGRLVR